MLQSSSLLMHFNNDKHVVPAFMDWEQFITWDPRWRSTPLIHQCWKNYNHIEKVCFCVWWNKVPDIGAGHYWHTFTLLTDHHPLVNLQSEDKPVPSVAAARIQWWVLTLSTYSYKIKYRKGSLHLWHQNQLLLLKKFDETPVTKHMIFSEVEKCPNLRMLKSYILKDFPKRILGNLISFLQVNNELSIEESIILSRSCVLMPPKFINFMMDELHSAHQGISVLKAVARSYVWWPEKI